MEKTSEEAVAITTMMKPIFLALLTILMISLIITTVAIQQTNNTASAAAASSSPSHHYQYYPTKDTNYYLTTTISAAATTTTTSTLTASSTAPPATTTTTTTTTVNKKPVAISTSYPSTVNEGYPVTLDGSKSYDPDGGSIVYYSWVQTAGPSVGSLSRTTTTTTAAVTTFKAPYVNSETKLQFQLTVKDNKGATASNSVIVTVIDAVSVDNNNNNNNNHPPIAYSQSVQTTQNTPVISIQLKAIDPDPGDTVRYYIVSKPLYGQLSGDLLVNPSSSTSSITYFPSSGFIGTDSFSFQAFDHDRAVSNVATVSIAINAVNHPPIAYSQSVQTTQNTPLSIQLKAIDPDPGDMLISYNIVSSPTHGTISNFDQSSGRLTYNPDLGFNGDDRFTLEVFDNHSTVSNVAVVSVTVTVPPTTTTTTTTTTANTNNNNAGR